MANSHRGEVVFTAGGKERTLRFGTNALCEIEEAAGAGINAVIERLQGGDPSIRTMRMLFAAGLGVPAEAAGAVMDEIGVAKAGELIGEALALAFPAGDGQGNGKAPVQ